MNTIYAGIDLHKKYSVITLMDEKGYQESPIRIDNKDTDKFINVLSQPNKLTRVAVESTFGWYWIADLLEPIPNVELNLTHTLGLSAFKTTGKKTDKIDSKFLADLLRARLLPLAHMTSTKHRQLKDILRHRSFLVQKRGDIKRRTHASLAKMNIHCPYSDIFGKKSRIWLRENVVKYPYDIELDSSLRLYDDLNSEISIMDKELDKYADSHPDIELITSVPGIGKIIGLTILSEIDDITRFPNHRKLCSYAGLVPTVSSSGGKTHYGKVKKGNQHIRTMLAEAISHAIRKDPFLNQKFEQIKESKGVNKARVAIMRKLMTSIYFVLSKREKYVIRDIVS